MAIGVCSLTNKPQHLSPAFKGLFVNALCIMCDAVRL